MVITSRLAVVFSACLAVALAADVAARGQRGAASAPAVLPPRPMANSPLAASNDRVFAIAEGQRHIITRPADLSRPWEVLDVGDFDAAAGLAVAGNGLYVSDSSDETIQHIDLATLSRTMLYEEGPLADPASIAVAGDVFVSDSFTGRLFRLRDRKLHEVMLDADLGSGRPLSLTASDDDLYVASPDGRILEFRGIGRADPAQVQAPRRQFRQRSSVRTVRYTVQKLIFRTIKEPSRIAVFNGVVYVVDGPNQSLFAFSKHDPGDEPRPVRLTRRQGWHAGGPTSVAVNDSSIYLMFGSRFERWPRIVPATVNLSLASVSEAMTLVYGYLQRRDFLALQQVALDENIEVTLKQHRVIPAHFPESLEPLVCDWNPAICDKTTGKIRPLQQGRLIWVPDLYSENYVDAVPVTLRDETLEDVAKRRIQSPEFSEWTLDARLHELNEPELMAAGATSAGGVRNGDFLVPTEYVRYLIPALPRDVAPGGELKNLEKVLSGLRILSLEERGQSMTAAASDTATPPPNLSTLKNEFAQMLKAISYIEPSVSLWPARVGIAEMTRVDDSHPDLAGAFLNITAAPPSAATTSSPATAVSYRIRSFEPADHATMVAGLIGARASGFESKGLAPRAVLLSLEGNNPRVGEDITAAFLNRVRIFNISAHYNPNIIPDALYDAIIRYPKALFVVAAGNEGREVCRGFLVYPACWSDLPNVLVVTATTPAADSLLAAANWSPRAVHVAAPGEGFHAPGVGRSYVPASGTSFATPLVTAAAALLYEQRFTDPWVIKQRLIASADPMPRAAGKVAGGLLNVKRALSDVATGVLSRPGADEGDPPETRPITVDADDWITVRRLNGDTGRIVVRKLLRFHREPTGQLHFVYVNDEGELQTLAGATFPNSNENAGRFRATTDTGASVVFDLVDWDDYLAPVPMPEGANP